MQNWTWTLGTRLSLMVTQQPDRQRVGLALEVDAYPQTAIQLTVSYWAIRVMYQWVWMHNPA